MDVLSKQCANLSIAPAIRNRDGAGSGRSFSATHPQFFYISP
ncbi:hypothetical protein [Brevundimonas nasdae]|jgi:hypothetical protein